MSGWIVYGGLLFPTALTGAYFVLLADQPAALQQTVYAVGKGIQFGFPAVVFLAVLGGRPGWRRPNFRGLVASVLFGALVLAAMLLLYRFWLEPSGMLAGLREQVWRKVQDLGVDSVARYVGLGVFYSLGHSLLEEYYWRWFVFGQLRLRFNLPAAVTIASLGFMAHHVILLATFLGSTSPLTYLFSLGVAAGGAVWACLYVWGRSLVGPWLSHILVDAAIFWIGYELIKDCMG